LNQFCVLPYTPTFYCL